MSTSFTYDENAAGHADDVANRVDMSGPYIGEFKCVNSFTTDGGSKGLHFEFTSASGGSVGFDLYTHKKDGSPSFGMNMVHAIMAVLGLKGLNGVQGKYEAYDFDEKKRVEKDGEVFPELTKKKIGLVLQKELYTNMSGHERHRMNLYGVFQHDTKLTASELKERKTTPQKLERMIAGLKDKDSRKAATPEPAQPSVGAGGDY